MYAAFLCPFCSGFNRRNTGVDLAFLTPLLLIQEIFSDRTLREAMWLEKTLFTLEWLQSMERHRRVQIGLNKREARNALARAVLFYRHGRIQDRSLAQQQQRAQELNLVVAAIILWNTLELARAVEEL